MKKNSKKLVYARKQIFIDLLVSGRTALPVMGRYDGYFDLAYR